MNFSENNMKNLCSYLNLNGGFDRNWTYNPCVLFPYGFGGGYEMSTAYLTRGDGPVNAASDPYNTTSGISPTGLTLEKWVQETIIIPGRKNPLDNNQIKDAIMKYGAVASTMRTANFTNYYNKQTYSFYYFGSNDPSQYNPDHAIDIVGWDDNYDKTNFNSSGFEPPYNGAFIIRNSWSSDWGDGGYFYISYYDRVLAKMDSYVFTAGPVTYNNVWYYDPYGMINWVKPQTTWWFSNVFRASKSEKLAAFSFYTLAPNTDYEFYVYLNPVSNPKDGTLAYNGSGTISTMGFKTI
jgi:C1A family cysteine protease